MRGPGARFAAPGRRRADRGVFANDAISSFKVVANMFPTLKMKLGLLFQTIAAKTKFGGLVPFVFVQAIRSTL